MEYPTRHSYRQAVTGVGLKSKMMTDTMLDAPHAASPANNWNGFARRGRSAEPDMKLIARSRGIRIRRAAFGSF